MSDETKTHAGESNIKQIRGEIEEAAEEFVEAALDALGLIWEPDEIQAEGAKLAAAAIEWGRE